MYSAHPECLTLSVVVEHFEHRDIIFVANCSVMVVHLRRVNDEGQMEQFTSDSHLGNQLTPIIQLSLPRRARKVWEWLILTLESLSDPFPSPSFLF